MTWQIRPIGTVRSPRVDDDQGDYWGAVRSRIELDPDVVPEGALGGLEGFSHIEVIFGFDRGEAPEALSGGRLLRGREDWGLVGELAQRNKVRFNRLAISRCSIERIEGGTIHVVALDALDGSPVFEIKPWMEEYGVRGPVRQTDWSHELMAKYYLDAPEQD